MVISDTHGDITRALELYRQYDKALSFDALIHCGDYEKDAARLEPHVGCPVVSVPGNCDGCHSRSFKLLDTPGGRILVTHGYAERVKESFTGLYYLALENDCSAVLFGHSHIPVVEKMGDITLVNPGSLTDPRGAMGEPTFAVLSSTVSGIKASVIKYYR